MYSKYFRSNIDPNCFIKYMINIDNFNDFWAHDFSHIFKGYEFIIIEEFNMNLDNPDILLNTKKLLKEFCDTMTIGNRIVVFHLNEFSYRLHQIYRYYDDIFDSLLELLDHCNFQVFEGMECDYNDSEVYFYIGSKLGNSILYNLESYYETELRWE